MKGEALKGHLDLMLLAILEEGPAHGYAVIEELARRSREAFDLPEGTVYPALHRLEAGGLPASRWVPHGGCRRQVGGRGRGPREAVSLLRCAGSGCPGECRR